jgi:hypothetical protein
MQKRFFELTNCENKSLRELTLFESGFKNIPNNVDLNIVHGHIFFETIAQIPEIEFGGKYGYMRANTDI